MAAGYGRCMPRPSSRHLLPTTTLGRIGSATALAGLLVVLALIVTDALQAGPDQRPGFWIGWLVITASGVLLIAALRRGERALAAYLALLPFGLFLLLLLFEMSGLIE